MIFPEVITTEYIVSQVVGIGVLILTCVSYFFKKDKMLFILGSVNLLESVAYFLLNSYVGAIGTILATIRCVAFWFCDKKFGKVPTFVFCIFILLFTASTLMFWHSYIDLLELALLIAFTTSFMLKEEWHVRSVALVGAILGIVYNLLIFNYIGVICRTVESIVLVVALIKFFKQRKKELVQYAE